MREVVIGAASACAFRPIGAGPAGTGKHIRLEAAVVRECVRVFPNITKRTLPEIPFDEGGIIQGFAAAYISDAVDPDYCQSGVAAGKWGIGPYVAAQMSLAGREIPDIVCDSEQEGNMAGISFDETDHFMRIEPEIDSRFCRISHR